MEHLKHFFQLTAVWLMTLNPDPIAKWIGVCASLFVIAASYSTIKKNKRK